jgi:hypothetical protein
MEDFVSKGTTGELFFAVRQYHTAKAQILSAKALPCGLARQRTHGNDPAGKGTFAVRRAKIARQRLCRAT